MSNTEYIFHEIQITRTTPLQDVLALIQKYKDIETDSKYKGIKHLIPTLLYTVLVERVDPGPEQTVRLYFRDIPKPNGNLKQTPSGQYINGIGYDIYSNFKSVSTMANTQPISTVSSYSLQRSSFLTGRGSYNFLKCFFIPYLTDYRVLFVIPGQQSGQQQQKQKQYQSKQSRFIVNVPTGTKFLLNIENPQVQRPEMQEKHLIAGFKETCLEKNILKNGVDLSEDQQDKIRQVRDQVNDMARTCIDLIQQGQSIPQGPDHSQGRNGDSSGSSSNFSQGMDNQPGTDQNPQIDNSSPLNDSRQDANTQQTTVSSSNSSPDRGQSDQQGKIYSLRRDSDSSNNSRQGGGQDPRGSSRRDSNQDANTQPGQRNLTSSPSTNIDDSLSSSNDSNNQQRKDNLSGPDPKNQSTLSNRARSGLSSRSRQSAKTRRLADGMKRKDVLHCLQGQGHGQNRLARLARLAKGQDQSNTDVRTQSSQGKRKQQDQSNTNVKSQASKIPPLLLNALNKRSKAVHGTEDDDTDDDQEQDSDDDQEQDSDDDQDQYKRVQQRSLSIKQRKNLLNKDLFNGGQNLGRLGVKKKIQASSSTQTSSVPQNKKSVQTPKMSTGLLGDIQKGKILKKVGQRTKTESTNTDTTGRVNIFGIPTKTDTSIQRPQFPVSVTDQIKKKLAEIAKAKQGRKKGDNTSSLETNTHTKTNHGTKEGTSTSSPQTKANQGTTSGTSHKKPKHTNLYQIVRNNTSTDNDSGKEEEWQEG